MGTLKFAARTGTSSRTLTMRTMPTAVTANPPTQPTMSAPSSLLAPSRNGPPLMGGEVSSVLRDWPAIGHGPLSRRVADQAGAVAMGNRLAIDVPRGGTIVTPGNGGSTIFQIAVGHVALYKALPGRRSVCVGMLGPGDVFTQEGAAGGGSGITAEALTDVVCVPTELDQLVAAFSASPETARGILLSLTRRLTEVQTLIERLLARDITLRLGGVLLDLADRFGQADPSGMTLLNIPAPHKMLARMIGGNRVTVTRVMTDLRAAGLVASPGRNRVLINEVGLRRVVNRTE